MAVLQVIWGFVSAHGWMVAAAFCTAGYIVVLAIMVRKILRDRAMPDGGRPPPRPLFYLGQAYLAFVWPVPLFMVLEALDVLSVSP